LAVNLLSFYSSVLYEWQFVRITYYVTFFVTSNHHFSTVNFLQYLVVFTTALSNSD